MICMQFASGIIWPTYLIDGKQLCNVVENWPDVSVMVSHSQPYLDGRACFFFNMFRSFRVHF